MNEETMLRSEMVANLPNSFKKRQAFDITYRATNLTDNKNLAP